MNSLQVLFIKEFRESWRSFKFVWIPLVFLLLGVSDPLMNYFMEDILQAVGNMPEGFQMMFPELQPLDLLMASTGQFQLTGVIVLIAVYVSTISRERSSGTATLIYIRPVSSASLFISKWVVAASVAVLSAVLGYAGSIYYTAVLYGSISAQAALVMIVTYAVWLLFVMSLTVALSAAFSTGVAATIAIIVIPIGGMIDSMIGNFWAISPWKLVNYGVLLVSDKGLYNDYWKTLAVTICLMIICIIAGVWATRYNRSRTKV